MKFYSTNDHSLSVSFEEALLQGLAPDYGLFTIPSDQIPSLDTKTIESLYGKDYATIAKTVLLPFLKDDFSDEELTQLLADAYDPNVIKAPIQHLTEKTYILWLTHGPTLSFKDYAARFFGRSLNHFLKKRDKKRLVIVATSGDTGGAIADALLNLERVHCVVLYPKDDVSAVQRRQMTTLGNNITAIAVNGDFDICQALAKRILNDNDFAKATFGDPEHITSANSISLGRLLPQIVFPFYAYSQIPRDAHEECVFSIPSGNFGDMMGTVIAKHMGLPIKQIICGVNENQTFPRFLETGQYEVQHTVHSPSSAMMVSHPSNVARLFDLYGGHIYDKRENGSVIALGVVDTPPSMESLKRDIISESVSNEDHYSIIREVYNTYSIIIEPHGAVAFKTLRDHLPNLDTLSVMYETADPAKFSEDVEKAIAVTPTMPPQVVIQSQKEEHVIMLDTPPTTDPNGKTTNDDQYNAFKKIIASLAK